jgi:hypothetical protein
MLARRCCLEDGPLGIRPRQRPGRPRVVRLHPASSPRLIRRSPAACAEFPDELLSTSTGRHGPGPRPAHASRPGDRPPRRPAAPRQAARDPPPRTRPAATGRPRQAAHDRPPTTGRPRPAPADPPRGDRPPTTGRPRQAARDPPRHPFAAAATTRVRQSSPGRPFRRGRGRSPPESHPPRGAAIQPPEPSAVAGRAHQKSHPRPQPPANFPPRHCTDLIFASSDA